MLCSRGPRGHGTKGIQAGLNTVFRKKTKLFAKSSRERTSVCCFFVLACSLYISAMISNREQSGCASAEICLEPRFRGPVSIFLGRFYLYNRHTLPKYISGTHFQKRDKSQQEEHTFREKRDDVCLPPCRRSCSNRDRSRSARRWFRSTQRCMPWQ